MTTACASLRPTAAPLRTVEVVRGTGEGRCLAVLLPGRFDRPERFQEAGFGRAVERRGLAVDLVAVDSHLGYFRARSIVERLHGDVIAPARAAGYETIWIVGTSLGGLGGLLYLNAHPDELAGVFAIAPYLGEDAVIEEIERAGGPAAWRPPETFAEGDIGRELWSWLGPWTRLSGGRSLHLGWGHRDSFDRANRLLAGLLPTDQVTTIDGGHDWRTWERLWEQFLDGGALCPSPNSKSEPLPAG